MRLVISSSSDTPDTLWRWLSIAVSTADAVDAVFWAEATALPTCATSAEKAWSAVPPESAATWPATSPAGRAGGLDVEAWRRPRSTTAECR